MNFKKMIFATATLLMAFAFCTVPVQAKKNYTITPKSKVLAPYTKSRNLNKYTRTWLMVKSYLEKMEKKGGGTLTFKKGTYSFTNAVYTPSNVKIVFKNGVKIVKGNKEGKTYLKLKPTDSIFQVTTPKLSTKKGKAKKYNGAKNVQFIGQGNVVFDLKKIKNSKAFIVAHTQNVTIENIQFKNMNTGHFIEMDAAKNVTVKNCSFTNATSNTPDNKEAINLDTPDKTTGGLNLAWSCSDKTPNYNVTIENCKFTNLKRGIGTHKYSQYSNGQNAYHEKIIVRNCSFNKIKESGIFLMNWKDTLIWNNTFANNTFCVNFRGVQAPFNFTTNKITSSQITYAFHGKQRTLLDRGYKNTGSGSQYSAIYNNMGITTVAELEAMNKIPYPPVIVKPTTPTPTPTPVPTETPVPSETPTPSETPAPTPEI